MTNPILYGTDNADFIVDTYDRKDINGLGGNDFIVATDEVKVEIIDGGTGSDTVSYTQLHGVHVDLGNIYQGYGWAYETNDMLTSVENLIGSNQDDTFLGSDVNNELYGMGGNNFLEGRGGAGKISGATDLTPRLTLTRHPALPSISKTVGVTAVRRRATNSSVSSG